MASSEFREPGLIDQPKPVLEKFFTPGLVELLLRDREEMARTGEIARLDFLPLWNSQDPSASELKVTAGSKPNTVEVSFAALGAEQRIVLTFVLEETSDGMRISDIEYAGGYSLAGLLKADD